MSENKIEISVKDIPEIVEQLKYLEEELKFERKSKNLFIDDLYKVCEISLKLENQLQQKENIIKEVREYIEPIVELDNGIMLKGKMLKPVLEILDKENV